METQILSAMLKERSTHELFERIGDPETFSPLGRVVFGAIGEYYGLDPDVQGCSRELIEERLLSRITNPKHVAPLKLYLGSLVGDVSSANVAAHIRELHRRHVGGKLSLALANGAPQHEVDKLVEDYSRGGTAVAASVGANSLVEFSNLDDLTSEDASNVDYIRLWPKQLNDRLDGGALRGHHVLVFARPEAGKTLFANNLCAGFLNQGLRVLYVANEEPVADIRDRLRGRVLKTTKGSIRGNRAESAGRLAGLRLGSLAWLESMAFSEVRHACERGRRATPFDVVVLDQIRNMRIKSEGRTSELEAAGIEARAIAKEFGVLVVSITQAGGSADGKVYLEMSDVDSSKTGLPASVDLMIGLGSDQAMKLNGLLGISLPKNKLGGVHDHFTVTARFDTGVIE